MNRRGTVLVVEADHAERERFGSILEESGYNVLLCPGPSAPDYTCVGGRGEPCPLGHAADVVVLDACLQGDAELAGTTVEELLSYYLTIGKPVIALGYRPGLLDLFAGEPLVPLDRHVDREELTEVLDALKVGHGTLPATRADSYRRE